jgi:hypothetical protein
MLRERERERQRERERERERLSRIRDWHNLYAHQASRNACVRLRRLPFYSLNFCKKKCDVFFL